MIRVANSLINFIGVDFWCSNHMQNLLCIGCGFISGFGLTYGVNDVAGVNGGVGFPGTGLC